MADGFDIVSFLMGKQDGSGGGGDITVESKSIDANGTYTAPTGKAYSPVSVSVPNSYAAGDEGKVVSNGALVAQSSDTVTQNGTVDTTLINSLEVNVSGGGNWTLLTSTEYPVNTTSTSDTLVGNIQIPGNYGPEDIIWVHIRDKAGKRNGSFYGTDTVLLNVGAKNNYTSDMTNGGKMLLSVTSVGGFAAASSTYGVFAKSFSRASSGALTANIYVRYNSSYGTINSTYKFDVYKLTPASGMTIFD